MNKLRIHLDEGRAGFRPREILRGTAEWQLDRAAAVEIRLCWFIDVQGVAEVRRVQTVRQDRCPASGQCEFAFRLPDGPFSYAGALAMLGWAVELVALPELDFAQIFFNFGPGAEVVELQRQLNSAGSE
jgi:hypothetical protein